MNTLLYQLVRNAWLAGLTKHETVAMFNDKHKSIVSTTWDYLDNLLVEKLCAH